MRNYSGRMLNPSNPKTGYQYARVFNGNNGYEITEAKMMGWEVVHGDDQEDVEHKAVDGTRVVGDTILLRIANDRRKEITEWKEELDYRLSGKAEDEAFDDMVRTKSQGQMEPFTFRTTQELKDFINKKGAK